MDNQLSCHSYHCQCQVQWFRWRQWDCKKYFQRVDAFRVVELQKDCAAHFKGRKPELLRKSGGFLTCNNRHSYVFPNICLNLISILGNKIYGLLNWLVYWITSIFQWKKKAKKKRKKAQMSMFALKGTKLVPYRWLIDSVPSIPSKWQNKQTLGEWVRKTTPLLFRT